MKDLCERYDASTLQQLYKIITDEENGGLTTKDVFPVTLVQSVFDALTGTRLDQILALNNCIWLPFKGTREATRLQVGPDMRRKGLIVAFRDYDGMTYTQRYLNGDSVSDEHWRYDDNWEDVFVGFGNLEFVEQLKQYLTEYIDEKLKGLLPPDGYEFVIVKKPEHPLPDGYDYVVYANQDGELVKVCTMDNEPVIRRISEGIEDTDY